MRANPFENRPPHPLLPCQPARTLVQGGATCDLPPLLGALDSQTTCVAGCCSTVAGSTTRQCDCHTGFTGALCASEMRCTAAAAGALLPQDVCHTATSSTNHSLVCSCKRLGQIAIFTHRVLPPTNLLLIEIDFLATLANQLPIVVLLVLLLLTYLFLCSLAYLADARTLYLAAPPAWMPPPPPRPLSSILFNRFVHYTRTLQSILRVLYVAPGYTTHTRLQLWHCLFLQVGRDGWVGSGHGSACG